MKFSICSVGGPLGPPRDVPGRPLARSDPCHSGMSPRRPSRGGRVIWSRPRMGSNGRAFRDSPSAQVAAAPGSSRRRSGGRRRLGGVAARHGRHRRRHRRRGSCGAGPVGLPLRSRAARGDRGPTAEARRGRGGFWRAEAAGGAGSGKTCVHGKAQGGDYCKECPGKGICEHGRVRSKCKEDGESRRLDSRHLSGRSTYAGGCLKRNKSTLRRMRRGELGELVLTLGVEVERVERDAALRN